MTYIITFEGEKNNPPCKRIVISPRLSLRDGINHIETKVYEKYLVENDYYKQGIKTGLFTEIAPKEKTTVKAKRKKTAVTKAVVEISRLTEGEAMKVAATEENLKQIEKWLKEEVNTQNRAKVVALLKEQIKHLKEKAE